MYIDNSFVSLKMKSLFLLCSCCWNKLLKTSVLIPSSITSDFLFFFVLQSHQPSRWTSVIRSSYALVRAACFRVATPANLRHPSCGTETTRSWRLTCISCSRIHWPPCHWAWWRQSVSTVADMWWWWRTAPDPGRECATLQLLVCRLQTWSLMLVLKKRNGPFLILHVKCLNRFGSFV